ncbi:hypothetical protein KR200_005335, partial [Drosophila serrata]
LYSIFRTSFLILLWAFAAVISFVTRDVESKERMVVSMPNTTIFKNLHLPNEIVTIDLRGPINKHYTDKMLVKNSPSIDVRVEWRDSTLERIFVRSEVWKVYVSLNEAEFSEVTTILKVIHLKKSIISIYRNLYHTSINLPEEYEPISAGEWGSARSVISFESKCDFPVGFHVVLHNSPEQPKMGLVYTFILIVSLYALVISEYIDRRFGAVLISIGALTLMSCIGLRPTFEMVASWIDFSTLMVLLGSMIMVALMWETGFFDFVTLVAYRTSKGHAWLLIYLLSMIAAIFAAILDNATVVMLLAPACIRVCEAAFLNTKIVLLILAIYAHIGGSMTPVGSAANILIINHMSREQSINFTLFTAHMLPASVMCMLSVYILLFFSVGNRIYKVQENQLERRRAMKQPTEEILHRMDELRKRRTWLKPVSDYYEILATVEANQPPMNFTLLAHIGVAFLFIFAGFVLRSMPITIPNASFAWITMLGALLLLILANQPNISPVLARIEWGILLYVSSLFIITEVIVHLGFITWLGQLTTTAVLGVEYSQQTISSMLIILWTSAVFSAFLDNTAVAAVLLKVCIEVEHSEDTILPLMSLVWALLLGSNYGGMGTLLGSLSNEFVAVVAKEHGYDITFMDFFYMGFPVMIFTLMVCSLYLLAAEVVFDLK